MAGAILVMERRLDVDEVGLGAILRSSGTFRRSEVSEPDDPLLGGCLRNPS